MLVRILNWSACMRLYRRFARFLTRAFARLRSSLDRLTLCCRGRSLPDLGRGHVRGCGQLAFGEVKPDTTSTRAWNEIRVALSESDE